MSQLFANMYDFIMSPLEKRKFKRIRKELLKNAEGTVLEIGAGTGVNFPHYKSADNVIAIEPSTYMIRQSHSKREQSQVPIEVIEASAEDLPFEDSTFDTVVATLVFCTIPNPSKALTEIKRVCKPNGKILLFEHVKMENRFLASLQNWLTPAWKKVADGCYLNRDTLGLLNSQRLPVEKVEKYYKGLFVVAKAVNSKQ